MKYSKIDVEYKDHMGSDLNVVNAARVSFGKTHSEFDLFKDEKLISFLAKNNHWSPFAHTSLTVKVKAPIFVARQLVKHQVGLAWNEESRRYIGSDIPPEFYSPKSWRKKAVDKKQGSSDETIIPSFLNVSYNHPKTFAPTNVMIDFSSLVEISVKYYNHLLNEGVAPEQARMVLPQNMMVNWYWTGSVYAFARICNLRIKPDAQEESREVAKMIATICENKFPISWKYLVN